MGLSLTKTIALIRALSLRNVPTDLVFMDATARDAFFATNPDRVVTGITAIINSNTTPVLELYQGSTPYDNTQWQDITSVIKGEKGDKGDAGELSADNILYVSASSDPAIPIPQQDGTRTNPFSTIQRAIDNLGAGDAGIEVVDGSVYTEDISVSASMRLFAPNAEIQGDFTIASGQVVNIYIQNISGTITDETRLAGFYRNGSRSVISAGTVELDLIADRVDISQELEVEQTVFIGTENTENSWRIQRNGALLVFARYETNAYVIRGSFGSSLTTDVLYLDSEQSTINFRDDGSSDIHDRNIVRQATATEFIEFGDARIPNGGTLIGGLRGVANTVTLVSDISDPDASLENFDIQTTSDTTGSINQIQYVFNAPTAPSGVDSYLIRSLEIDFGATKTVRSRLEIFDVTNDRLLYETIPASQLADAPQFTGTGVTNLNLFRLLFFTPGNQYRITEQFDQSYDFGGTDDTGFQPYFRLKYWDSISYFLRQKTVIRNHSADFTIDSSNYLMYRDNFILFTNTSGVVNLTISDNISTENDEILLKHYSSSPSMAVGVNVTQLGTGSDIEGQSILQLRNNTSATIKYIGDNKWRITNSHGMGGSAPVPITPEAHAFSIDIPSRVDVNESPDTINTSHDLSYSVTNHSLITSAVLHIGTSAFVLPLPTVDGVNTATVNVTSIDLSSAQNYNMYIELNMDTSLRSNIQVLRVANLPQQEQFFYGVSTSNDPSTVDVATLTLKEISVTETFNADFEIPNTNWSIILTPSNYTVSSIIDRTFNQEILNEFTYTQNVRTIGAQSYDSYVLQSNAGVAATLSTSIKVEV